MIPTTYIVFKEDEDIDEKSNDLEHAVELDSTVASLENLIVCVLNSLACRQVKWSVPQVGLVRDAILQVMKEQGV